MMERGHDVESAPSIWRRRTAMEHYAGIDVSLELSSVCVVDAQGKIVKEAKVASEPEAVVARVRGYKLWQFEEAFSRYLPSERGLSSRRVQDLAEWYSHQAYWHYSRNALDAGALDADLRAILRKEVSPWHVEIEAERVVTASRFASPSGAFLPQSEFGMPASASGSPPTPH